MDLDAIVHFIEADLVVQDHAVCGSQSGTEGFEPAPLNNEGLGSW